jgi:hypothetical protein
MGRATFIKVNLPKGGIQRFVLAVLAPPMPAVAARLKPLTWDDKARVPMLPLLAQDVQRLRYYIVKRKILFKMNERAKIYSQLVSYSFGFNPE